MRARICDCFKLGVPPAKRDRFDFKAESVNIVCFLRLYDLRFLVGLAGVLNVDSYNNLRLACVSSPARRFKRID